MNFPLCSQKTENGEMLRGLLRRVEMEDAVLSMSLHIVRPNGKIEYVHIRLEQQQVSQQMTQSLSMDQGQSRKNNLLV